MKGMGHEGDWAPDGQTYYATAAFAGTVTAIDVSNPSAPRSITTFRPTNVVHGLGVSQDGKRMYLAQLDEDTIAQAFVPRWPRLFHHNGLGIYDVSEVAERRPNPHVRLVGEVTWSDGEIGQHVIPIRIGGRPYVVFVDEGGYGGPRIIDVSDETKPRVISKLKTEIQMPHNRARAEASRHGMVRDGQGANLPWGYNSHYCNVDRSDDPTILACSNLESGLRVFDIRDPHAPREIAYFNPGGDGHRRPGSWSGATSGYTADQPRIVTETGEVWFMDMDRGLYIVRFTNGTWPFRS
jgi:Uncharacterized conserved protein